MTAYELEEAMSTRCAGTKWTNAARAFVTETLDELYAAQQELEVLRGAAQKCGQEMARMMAERDALARDLAAARAERDHYRTCADASELLVGAEKMRQAAEDQLAATRAEATQDRNKLADSRDKARAERDEARAAAAKANERAEREIAEAVHEAGLRKDAEADCAALRARCEALASEWESLAGKVAGPFRLIDPQARVMARDAADALRRALAAPAPEVKK